MDAEIAWTCATLRGRERTDTRDPSTVMILARPSVDGSRQLAALAVLALVLAVGVVGAAGPPIRWAEARAPGPLLVWQEPALDPVGMALTAFGTTTAPIARPLALTGALYLGEQARAWQLEGPLTMRFTRISLGASTLALTGFGAVPGSRALSALGVLQVGHHLDCWALIDTDRFRALPREWLSQITDSQAIGVGGVEAEIYSRVLIRAHYTSTRAFAQAARREVTYRHIFHEPERYRGTVVHVEGKLVRIDRFDPPYEATLAGVSDLYEAWINTEQIGSNLYCVVFTEWPEGLSRELLGQSKVERPIRVSFDGYFFKKYRYQARGRGQERDAPLLLGHGLTVVHEGLQVRPPTVWINTLTYLFVGVLLAVLLGVIVLTYWYRRADQQVRRRILARMPEFELPEPDIAPSSAPLAMPVSRMTRGKRGRPWTSRFARADGPVEGEELPGTEEARAVEKPPDEGPGVPPRP